jgi:hypothetical protein
VITQVRLRGGWKDRRETKNEIANQQGIFRRRRPCAPPSRPGRPQNRPHARHPRLLLEKRQSRRGKTVNSIQSGKKTLGCRVSPVRDFPACSSLLVEPSIREMLNARCVRTVLGSAALEPSDWTQARRLERSERLFSRRRRDNGLDPARSRPTNTSVPGHGRLYGRIPRNRRIKLREYPRTGVRRPPRRC